MKSKLFVVLSSLGILTYAQEAQKDSLHYALDQVEIVSARTNQTNRHSSKVVEKIQKDVLEGQWGISHAINQMTGVEITNAVGKPGDPLSIRIRGGKNNVQLRYNGVPLLDASSIESNYFDINTLSASQISSVEMVKGGNSTLYGANASTAVIDVKSVQNKEKGLHTDLGYSYGSFGTHTLNPSVYWKNDNWNTLVNYTYQKSDGFSSAKVENGEKDGWEKSGLLAELGYQKNDFKTGIIFNQSNLDYDFDASAFTDGEETGSNKSTNLGVYLKQPLGSVNWDMRVSLGLVDRSTNQSFGYSEFNSKSVFTESIWKKTVNQIEIIGGLSFQENRADENTPFSSYDSDSTWINQKDVFVSLHKKGEKFSIQGGTRYVNHSIYGGQFSSQIQPVYFIQTGEKEGVKLRSSFSNSFVNPSLYQYYSFYGNKELKPQKSFHFEGGVSGYKKDMDLNVTYFYREEQDPIIFYYNPNTFTSNYAQGVNTRFVRGLEFSANKNSNNYKWGVNYTYIHTLEDDSFLRIPAHKINLSYTKLWNNGLSTSVNYSWKDRVRDLYFAPDYSSNYVDLESRTLLDFRVSKMFLDNSLKVYLEMKNSLNVSQPDVYGYEIARRNFIIGVKYGM